MQPARDLGEVEVVSPAERPGHDDPPLLRVPPARPVALPRRPPPVVRNAEELARAMRAHVSSVPMHRLSPALAATASPRILELLGNGPGRVLGLGFAGIHAQPLELSGWEVVVVDSDPRA